MMHWAASAIAYCWRVFPASRARRRTARRHLSDERTDCYLALNQFYRAQSDLAAAKARNQTPLGIGQLQEQSFQEVNRNSDDKVKPG